jgi:nitroreductase
VFERPAPADHPIHELLARRRSTRVFTGQAVTLDVLRQLFEAARWAPSSGNGQPWSYLVARKEEAAEFARIASVLAPGNAWAKAAAVLAIAVAALDRVPGKPNVHAWHDVGLANENLAIQATALGLSIHMMGGYNVEQARELFAIPERWTPVCAIAIGYAGDPAALDEELRKKELAARQRKPIREFVFSGTWGQPGGLE